MINNIIIIDNKNLFSNSIIYVLENGNSRNFFILPNIDAYILTYSYSIHVCLCECQNIFLNTNNLFFKK